MATKKKLSVVRNKVRNELDEEYIAKADAIFAEVGEHATPMAQLLAHRLLTHLAAEALVFVEDGKLAASGAAFKMIAATLDRYAVYTQNEEQLPARACTRGGKVDVGVTVKNLDSADVEHWWHPRCWDEMTAWLSCSAVKP